MHSVPASTILLNISFPEIAKKIYIEFVVYFFIYGEVNSHLKKYCVEIFIFKRFKQLFDPFDSLNCV